MPRETVERRFEVPVPPPVVHALRPTRAASPRSTRGSTPSWPTRDEDPHGERQVDFDVTAHVGHATTVEAPRWVCAVVFRSARKAHDVAVTRVRECLGG